MASPNHKAVSSSENIAREGNEGCDEELDFCSANFNPERALLSPQFIIPRPDSLARSTQEPLSGSWTRRAQDDLPAVSAQSNSETPAACGKDKSSTLPDQTSFLQQEKKNSEMLKDERGRKRNSRDSLISTERSRARAGYLSERDIETRVNNISNERRSSSLVEKRVRHQQDKEASSSHHDKTQDRQTHDRNRSYQSVSYDRDSRDRSRYHHRRTDSNVSYNSDSSESRRSRKEHHRKRSAEKSSWSHSTSSSRGHRSRTTETQAKTQRESEPEPASIHHTHEKHKQRYEDIPSSSTLTKKETEGFRNTPEMKILKPYDLKTEKPEICRQSRDSQQQLEKPDNHEGKPAGTSKKGKGNKRNVFTRMASMEGPLRLLTRCVEEHLQVRVMTRSAVAVRSICRGFIVTFDKFFNMAMIDVDEIYRRPAALGKIRSRRTHKLQAAQKTLQKEREELQTKWQTEKNNNPEIIKADSTKPDLPVIPDVSVTDLQNILSAVSEKTITLENVQAQEQSPAENKEADTITSSASQAPSSYPKSKGDTDAISQKMSRLSQMKLRRIQSVYKDLKAPLSPFEREALMLGIADENVEHRHINQLFIRGENIVMVSIIEDI